MQNCKKSLAYLVCWALAVVAISSPASFGQGDLPEETDTWTPGQSMGWNFKNLSPEQQQRMLRVSAFISRELPEKYLMATNTIGYTITAIAAGGPLYVAHCQKCHGESGLGNGELAQALTPSPALLSYLIKQPIAIDQYLLWTISEGGKQFGTAMPAFKDVLTQEQIWDIVAYLRAGFPAIDGEGNGEGNKVESGSPPAASTDEPKPNTKPVR
jgi:mono/diheme cytochrome c family protein